MNMNLLLKFYYTMIISSKLCKKSIFKASGLLLFLLLTITACHQNQRSEAERFQEILEKEISEEVPGVLASVYYPEKEIFWSGAAGLDDVAAQTTLRADQVFRIASVTKTFVAAAILRLWEEGQLQLDEPISRYISKEHNKILVDGGYDTDAISIRNLLYHNAGLADHTNSARYIPEEEMDPNHVWTRTEQLMELTSRFAPLSKPGEKFSYSDSGYILLGEIIENITGKTLNDAISNLLDFEKLGLHHTYFEVFEKHMDENRIHQYYQGMDTYTFHPSLDLFGGGGLLSNCTDLATFFHALFNHGVYHHESTLDTMLVAISYSETPAMDYRMGIYRIMINNREAFTHTGFFGTQVACFPDLSLCIAANYSQRWPISGPAPVIPELLKALKAGGILPNQ
jgi:D-alanyl-D-alanine carboxypeptidase